MLSWLTLVVAVGSPAGAGTVGGSQHRLEPPAPVKGPFMFWLCQLGAGVQGNAQGLCQNVSRLAPGIDSGSGSQIFYQYYGRLPVLDYPPKTTPGNPSWCNGGVPQLANLSLHSAKMSRDLDKMISQDYSGLIVLDYELWWPTWNVSSELYHNASRAVARSQLPANASDGQVEAKARADFDKASVDFFHFTTTETRRLRPNARIGWYAGTTTYGGSEYWNVLDHRDDVASERRVHAAQLKWWAAVDVLMPTLYMRNLSQDVKSAFVERMFNSSQHINELLISHGYPPKPVIPYTWYRYTPYAPDLTPGAVTTLSDADADIEFFGQRMRAEASQAVVWGSEPSGGASAAAALGWFASHASQFDRHHASERAVTRDRGHRRYEGRDRTAPLHTSPGLGTTAVERQGQHSYHPAGKHEYATGRGSAPPPTIDPRGSVPAWQECSL
jgi:hypothetical protein